MFGLQLMAAAFVLPPNLVHTSSALHASSTALHATSRFADLAASLGCACFVSICALQSAQATMIPQAKKAHSRIRVEPVYQIPEPMTAAHSSFDDSEDATCYPIDWSDCETCEYDEEQSEYYGKPIWHCVT